MAFLKDQKVIFILMNVIVVSLVKRIKKLKFFKNAQMFGFTGTPILKKMVTL